MNSAPRGLRMHIGIFGRRNVGKSSLLNALTGQNVSIVSDHAGTTTDPVEKPMELLPLGPVLFIDTAGVDDEGELGDLRTQKSLHAIDRTDLGILVTEAGNWGEFENRLAVEFHQREIPFVVAVNKIDLLSPDDGFIQFIRDECNCSAVTTVSSATGEGILPLKNHLLNSAPPEFLENPDLMGDLVGPGELALLVVPIDKEAPKGRLIMPQVQSIRNLLDNDAMSLVVKERELHSALENLKRPPALVVTDSQAFLKVAGDTPPEIPMTSFSILFARRQGDLTEMVRGVLAIDALQSGDQVLVAESCTHHPIGEDIGRVKIPRWIKQYTGSRVEFHQSAGRDFTDNLQDYKLVIHCGACMTNRREMLSRIMHVKNAGIPITNYGLTIAYSLGIFERALAPFPAALAAYHRAKEELERNRRGVTP